MRFLLLLTISAASWAQTAAPLNHFAEIDKNVYVGAKPHSDKQFEYLKEHHVRYIVNARFLPFLSGGEERKAKKYGMQFIAIPLNASPVAPSRKHVDEILRTLHNTERQPVYLHCVLGRDRTSLLLGLYKIYFQGVSKADAFTEMRKSGFRTVWFLHGLQSYFNKQAGVPIK
jgi:protein-tyrosine phosphatase